MFKARKLHTAGRDYGARRGTTTAIVVENDGGIMDRSSGARRQQGHRLQVVGVWIQVEGPEA